MTGTAQELGVGRRMAHPLVGRAACVCERSPSQTARLAHSIARKVHLTNRTQAALFALKEGLARLEDAEII